MRDSRGDGPFRGSARGRLEPVDVELGHDGLGTVWREAEPHGAGPGQPFGDGGAVRREQLVLRL